MEEKKGKLSQFQPPFLRKGEKKEGFSSGRENRRTEEKALLPNHYRKKGEERGLRPSTFCNGLRWKRKKEECTTRRGGGTSQKVCLNEDFANERRGKEALNSST